MRPWLKILVGLAVALLAGWLHHGPYGGGERFVKALDARAQLRLKAAPVPGVAATMQRDPLARVVQLSGQADSFQKNGLQDYPGINQRMESIPGVSGIRWNGENKRVMPLLLETLLLCALAFAIGLGLGRYLFTRRKRTSYLD
ncbi:MAG TPA: hypothetical protein VGB79_01215 [Allosphingosinicella sp.]|jgi:hypothetical protein